MRIALDAMAGDFGPEPLVRGAIRAVEESRNHVILVGDAEVLEQQYAGLRKALEDVASYRANEPPRWRANYDLIYAQLVGYEALCREYQACLLKEAREPSPSIISPLVVVRRTVRVTDEKAQALAEELHSPCYTLHELKADTLYQTVKDELRLITSQ